MTDNSADIIVKRLHSIGEELLRKGKSDSEIVSELTRVGNISTSYAEQILNNIYEDINKKKQFRKHILSGTFVTVAGLLINYLSYKFAYESGSGTFLLIWGIVVIGIINILRGLILYRK